MTEIFQNLLNLLPQEALLLALSIAVGVELLCLVKFGTLSPTEIVKHRFGKVMFSLLTAVCFGFALQQSYKLLFSTVSAMSHLEYGINRYGSDLPTPTPVDSPDQCSELCAKEARCVSFSYVSILSRDQPYFGKSGTCWLKDALPAASANPCCVSGYKRGAAAAAALQSPKSFPTPSS